MCKKRYIEIKSPLPRKEQETTISRNRGESWKVSTSEPTFARELQRRGYTHVDEDDSGHYLNFIIAPQGVTVRSRKAVENPHQAANLPNRTTGTRKSAPISPKVDGNSYPERPIVTLDSSSPSQRAYDEFEGLKSPKVDGLPQSARASVQEEMS